jgi:hypothetical protein
MNKTSFMSSLELGAKVKTSSVAPLEVDEKSVGIVESDSTNLSVSSGVLFTTPEFEEDKVRGIELFNSAPMSLNVTSNSFGDLPLDDDEEDDFPMDDEEDDSEYEEDEFPMDDEDEDETSFGDKADFEDEEDEFPMNDDEEDEDEEDEFPMNDDEEDEDEEDEFPMNDDEEDEDEQDEFPMNDDEEDEDEFIFDSEEDEDEFPLDADDEFPMDTEEEDEDEFLVDDDEPQHTVTSNSSPLNLTEKEEYRLFSEETPKVSLKQENAGEESLGSNDNVDASFAPINGLHVEGKKVDEKEDLKKSDSVEYVPGMSLDSFLRKNPGIRQEKDVLQYFSKDEVQRNIRLGKVLLRKGKIVL